MVRWAGETDPRVIFRNIVQRPRHKTTGALLLPLPFFFFQILCLFSLSLFIYGIGETVTIVGDHDTTLLKYFDCTRSGPRSAFDSNVVYQFEIMEYVCHCLLLMLNFVAHVSCLRVYWCG